MTTPIVTALTFSDALINDADAGGTRTLTITFSEVMNTAIAPTVSSNATSTLTSPSGVWLNSTTFVVTYTIVDANVEVTPVAFAISGATAAAGDVMAPATLQPAVALVVDTLVAAPAIALATDSGTPGDNLTNDATVNVTLAADMASWQYSTDGGGTWTTGVGTSFELPSSDATYAVQVRQTDTSGNTSANATASYTLDATAPVALSPSSTTVDENQAVAFEFDNFTNDDAGPGALTYSLATNPGSAFALVVDGGVTRLVVNNAAYFDFEDRTSVAVDILATDAAGNATTTTYTVNLNDINDAPELSSAGISTLDATYVERADTVPNEASENDPTGFGSSGNVIYFHDDDVTDTHFTSTANVSTTASSFVGVFFSGLSSPAAVGEGQVEWSFSVTDPAHMGVIDALAVGESIVQVYNVTIIDQPGLESLVVPITVTIIGANDAPVITASGGDIAQTLNEAAETGPTPEDNAGDLLATGNLAFADVDDSNTFAADVTGVTATGTLGSFAANDPALLALMTAPAGGAVTEAGGIAWSFTGGEDLFDYLNSGEDLVLEYTIEVADNDGGVDTQVVTLTIEGRNDAPVVTVTNLADDAEGNSLITVSDGDNVIPPTAAPVDLVTIDLLSDDIDTHIGGASGTAITAINEVDDSDTQSINTVSVTNTTSAGVLTDIGFDATDVVNAFDISAQDGTISYNRNALLFDRLDDGESVSIDIQYTVHSGTDTEVRTVSLTINGANDAPYILSPPTSLAGTVTEFEDGSTASGMVENTDAHVKSGTIDFDDLELTDTHTVFIIPVEEPGTTPALADYIGTLSSGFPQVATGTGAGQITWVYSVNDAVLDTLSEGQSITQLYQMLISDGTSSLSQNITITIVGTNDAPVIEAATVNSATADEQTGLTGDATLISAGGTIVFSDVDLDALAAVDTANADVHSVSNIVFVDSVHERGASVLDTNTTVQVGGVAAGAITAGGSADEHQFGWTFSIADNQLDFLADGDTLTVQYDITVDDGTGTANSSTTERVSVVITGTNDAPVVTAAEVNATSLVEAGVGVVDVAEVSGDVSSGGNWGDVDSGEQVLLAVNKGSHDGDAQAALVFDGTGSGAMASEATILGTYGALYINADGSYRYVLDNANAATQALDNEDTVTELFNYTIANGPDADDAATSTITVSIEGSNDAPVITVALGEDAGAVVEAGVDGANMAVPGTPTATGTLGRTDVDGDDDASNDTWSVDAQVGQTQDDLVTVTGTYGTLSVDQNGVWTYTLDNADADTIALDGGESASETFIIGLSDNDPANEGSSSQTVTIAITGSNDAPVLTVVAGDNDVTEAGLDLADGVTPIGDATATGSFTVADDDASDGVANDLWSIVSINGTAVAVPTEANGTNSEETGVYGSLSLDASGAWTYTLDDTAGGAADQLDHDDVASETFTVRVADGNGGYDEEVVSVNIQGSNDGPVANVDATSFIGLGNIGNVQVVDEDAATLTIDVLANDTDIDGGDAPANFSLDTVDINSVTGLSVGSIAAGSFAIAGNQLAFTPGSEFDELDVGDTAVVTVAYTMSDDSGAESVSSVTITVTGSNDGPVIETGDAAFNAAASLTETDGVLSASGQIVFSDIDADDTPEATVVTATATVAATGISLTAPQQAAFQDAFSITDAATGTWDYTLAAMDSQFLADGDAVEVTFTVTVTDDHAATATHDVTITITGTNDAPVVTAADNVTHLESVDDNVDPLNRVATVLDAAATLTDVESDSYDGGSLTVSVAGSLATDLLNFITGSGVTVNAINSEVSVSGTVIGTASGLDTGTLSVLFNDMASVASIETLIQAVAYATSEDDPTGLGLTRSIDITVDDGAPSGTSNTETVIVTITPQNDSPTPLDDTAAVNEGSSVTFNAIFGVAGTALDDDSDPEGDSLSGVRVTDVLDASGDPSVIVAETAPIDAFSPGTITTDFGAVVTVNSTGSVQYDLTSPSAFFNHLAGGETAVDTFSYEVSDGFATTEATVSVTITGVNDAITANDDIITADEALGTGTSGNLVLNDVDIDTIDTKTVIGIIAGPGVSGVVSTLDGFDITLTSGVVVAVASNGDYTVGNLDAAHTGGDIGSFQYTVQDSGGVSSNATVTFNVTGENDAALITGDTSGTAVEDAGTPATGDLDHTDVDGNNADDAWNTTVVSQGSYGTLTLDAAGNWSYAVDDSNAAVNTLNGDDSLSDSVTVATTDGTEQVISITIDGSNDAPVVGDGTSGVWTPDDIQAGTRRAVLAPEVEVSDAESEELTYRLTTAPLAGAFYLAGMQIVVGVDLTRAQFEALTYEAPEIADVYTAQFSVSDSINITPISVSLNVVTGIDEVINGTAAADTLDGAAGNDVIHGLDGNDTIYAGSGADRVYGDAADDFIFGGSGEDVLRGGDGADDLQGEGDNDVLAGNSGDDTLRGGDGDDLLFGGSGDDALHGDSGNDSLHGGTGSDLIRGGDGNDHLWGDDGDDILAGNNGDDILRGGDGADALFGGAGNDTLAGNEGSDQLNGGDGNDIFFGGAGDDTLTAGHGSDVLTGNGGADVFVWADKNESLHSSGDDRDEILDFQIGLDQIDLSGFAVGGDALTFTGATYSGTGTPNEVRYNATIGRLYIDTNGDGASDFSIDISGAPALTADDLIF